MEPRVGIGSKSKTLSAHWSPRKEMPLPVESVRIISKRLTPTEGAWMKAMPVSVVLLREQLFVGGITAVAAK